MDMLLHLRNIASGEKDRYLGVTRNCHGHFEGHFRVTKRSDQNIQEVRYLESLGGR